MEALDDYSQSGEVEAYRAFLVGEEQPESYRVADWLTTVGNSTRAGKRVYRAPVLSHPLEEFFILDTTESQNPTPDAPDFWLYLGSDIVEEEARLAEFRGYRDTALAHAVPFAEWWAAYGE